MTIPGVLAVQLDWQAGKAIVRHRPETQEPELIKAVVTSAVGTGHQYGAAVDQVG